jgi:ligand-binding SRPBCC domain-containing protein
MAEYVFKASSMIARPRDDVFDFFSQAENLGRITPPELQFEILTKTPIELRKGTLIDYRLRLNGIPMKWRTEITVWNPPYEFEDTQLSGPYKQWIHRHRFTEDDPDTTLMEDEVRYRLPLEPLGDIVQFLIAGQIEKIFRYREQTIGKIFGKDRTAIDVNSRTI